jgi:eukaryotic-like serine/threonine-protein kinase
MGDPEPRVRETTGAGGSEAEATVAGLGSNGPPDALKATLAGESEPGQATVGESLAHDSSVTATGVGDATPAEQTPTPPAARPAPTIAGYEIEGELGRGAMGVVYLARQVRLNRPCALKVILAGAHADPVAAVRFLGEAEAVARLQHPGIVQIHAIGEADGLPFFELEYVPGGSLDRTLNGTPWPARRAATLVEALTRAVVEAHRLGIVHRDLKPGNILIATDGMPKVADFGLAKSLNVASGLTATGSIMGTPSYMAPEQAEGKAKLVGPLADVYALGAILYELLTGRPPFRGATVLETLEQVKHAEPVPPSRLVPGLPRDIETIALKCLQKEAAKRYDSAAALAEDLRRFQSGEPIRARPSGPLERTWRWSRRNPSLAGLLLALAMAILTGFVGVTMQWIRAEQNAVKEANARRAAEDAEERTGRYLYIARMNLAQQAAEAGQNRRLLEVLSPYQPGTREDSLRGFEWYYWWRTCHLYQDSLDGDGGFVRSLAFRPNSRMLASGSADGKIRYWDYVTGKLASTFKGHAGEVMCTAFSPDGTLLATGGVDSFIRIWRSAVGELKSTLEGNAGPVRSVAFSPDGTTLASAHADGTIRLWDAASGRPKATLRGHNGRVFTVAFSPDGTVLASGGHDHTVRLWNPATYELGATLQGHSDWVRSVAFSPDGTLLASSGDDFTVVLWDVAAGRLRATLKGHTNNVNTVAFSPDGTTLASSGEDATLRLWDPASGRIKATLRGHTGGVVSVAFPADGVILASASGDGTVKLWNHAAVQPETTLEGHRSWVYSVAIASDSTTLASASFDGTIRLWDLKAGKLKRAFGTNADHARYVAFSPDGTTLASAHADGTIRLWDTASGRPKATLLGHASAVLAVVFSPDGTTLASTSFDKTVRLWDIHTCKPTTTLLAPGSVVNPEPLGDHALVSASVSFSPDGATLASSNTDRGVTLWNLTTGEPKATLDCQPKMIFSLAFSLDGKTLATAGLVLDLELWDTDTGNRKTTLKGHSVVIRSVAFCPDGKSLASASDDRTITLWDIVTGEPKTTLKGHDDYASCLAFSPDGAILVSGSRDKSVKLWRAATEEEVLAHRK